MARPTDSADFLPGFEDISQPPFVTEFNLRHGDCVAGMKTLPAESVDLVVTSPPYNLGINYSTYKDTRTSDEYLDWTREWAGEVKRVLKPDGALFLNIGATPANPWMPHEVALALRDLYFLQNTIHWIKSITVQERDSRDPLSVGHFKPINSKRFVNDCHEFVFHFTKTGKIPVDRIAAGVPYADKSNIKRWKHTHGRDKRCRGNTWFIPYNTIQSRDKERPHPATFPVALAVQCIRLHGRSPNLTTMLEPFLGIGHAALAAGQCDVANFTGFEIDEAYLEEARERVTP
ncbi:MAG: site-specific DNA-methyltransferase [Verrucomicrobiales bacterium]|nr:site-specific DNA-methyltransferase [Verrucomicrobiales bacterium]